MAITNRSIPLMYSLLFTKSINILTTNIFTDEIKKYPMSGSLFKIKTSFKGKVTKYFKYKSY